MPGYVVRKLKEEVERQAEIIRSLIAEGLPTIDAERQLTILKEAFALLTQVKPFRDFQ
jgi:hypothetical protein